jgi:tetratricopeptide (TPR) repeat protein
VLGTTGVGKSRLVEEFLQSLDGRPRVLRGHCPPYGPGITYRPIMQLVQQAAEIRPGESSDRIQAQVRRLVGGDERITARVMRLFGVRGALGDPDETFRAVQRVFELLASHAPLVLVVEDLHAAQPASLEAIERLIESLQDSQVLILCLARSEFLDGYRNWGASIANAVSVRLSPLSESQAAQIVRHLMTGGEPPGEAQERVVAWSGGNPFYLIELVGMLTDEGALRLVDGQWQVAGDLSDVRVTPKIGAVLGARLSRLEETDQTLIQRASVVGMQFRVADVAALMSNELDHDAVAEALDELVRKELLIRDPTALAATDADGEGFSFRHLLIQDTAYRRLDKLTRSELHGRYAQWLEGTEHVSPASLNQIGFHLDKAYRDRTEELGREDDDARALANRAGEFLAEAGHQYVQQGDFPASAITSLQRAVELLPPDSARQLQARFDLAEALRDHGAAEAHSSFEAVETAARDAGDRKVEMHALLGRLELGWFQEFPAGWEDGRQAVERAILHLVRLGDNLGLAKAYRLLAHGYTSIGKSIKGREAAEQAIEFVRRAGDERLEAKILRLYCVILFWGPTPLDEVVRRNQEALNWARPRGLYTLEAGALGILPRAAAMRGDFAQARTLTGEARSLITDVGELLTVAYDSISEGLIELLAGDADAAIRALQRGYEALERRGGRSPLAVVAANLARAFILKEQYDDAERLVDVCRKVATESQLDTQIRWRALRAVVLARRGAFDEAEPLAKEAVEFAERSEQLDSQAEALADLADVLQRGGAPEAATGHAERALRLYELKGNLVAATRVRRWLDQLPAATDDGASPELSGR